MVTAATKLKDTCSLEEKLKLFTADWDSNPCARIEPSQNRAWDSNPDKTHSTWFQNLMKLRYLMSHHRKNLVGDKVIGKKWIYSDTARNTLHRQSMGQCRGRMWP